jgi:hypothetical protein
VLFSTELLPDSAQSLCVPPGTHTWGVKREELIARFLNRVFDGWHWWHWHFTVAMRGGRVPFIDALLDALLDVDAVMPGYAKRTADSLVALGGPEKHEPHYDQILQRLAEVHVVRQLVTASWPWEPQFEDEPAAEGSAKNPEVVIRGPNVEIGVEVKAPALLEYSRIRGARPVQAGGRVFPPKSLEGVAGGPDKLTLPRDNPVKDFLASADEKFASFRASNPEFRGALVIVWDDFIYEPVTALTHPSSGLFTPNSFAKDAAGAPLRFENVDGVIVISHLQWLKIAMAEDGSRMPFEMSDRAFEYDFDPGRPAAYIENPHGRGLPSEMLAALNARTLSDLPGGAEYHPQDVVFWVNTGAESEADTSPPTDSE